MACGIPVVATDVGGVSEVVKDGETGLLAPADDTEALAGKIQELLFYRPRARSMGQAARADVERRFTRDRVVAQYEELYRRVLRQDCAKSRRPVAACASDAEQDGLPRRCLGARRGDRFLRKS